jgi:hypothetical protein
VVGCLLVLMRLWVQSPILKKKIRGLFWPWFWSKVEGPHLVLVFLLAE